MARIAAWCLGVLIRSDAIADMLAEIGMSQPYASTPAMPQSASACPEDYSAAIYAVARMSRSVKIAKALAKSGAMRPNSSDMAKVLLDAGVARGWLGLQHSAHEEGAAGRICICNPTLACAEWGGGTRKALVDAGVPYPEVHIELANAGRVARGRGRDVVRKEIVNAGGIDILKRVASLAARAEVAKACNQAATSIIGNVWSRNAASAKAALAHDGWRLPRLPS
ncbi:hypothetical protein B0H13DRAFT_2251444 [Mycena leptocephala]|nr:hypothetical protein B0H13DRAFT_2251444 [Mycena leptocephala]